MSRLCSVSHLCNLFGPNRFTFVPRLAEIARIFIDNFVTYMMLREQSLKLKEIF